MEGLNENILVRVNKWMDGNYDSVTKGEIKALIDANQVEALTDAFYKDLEFGTGGMRGIMGVGTNRINKYTLGAATQGLSNYLKSVYGNKEIKVALTHDNRNNAVTFAQVVADVFSANGIYVYFFESMRPTPELSFAIRQLGCQSGVMLTASHNPKEYSGYKAYWEDGGQIVAPHDENIIEEVIKITSVDDINFNAQPDLIQSIGGEMDDLFIAAVRAVSLDPDVILAQNDLKIVYTPIHGTGVNLVPRALSAIGFTNVNLVEEQCVVDGNFPTVIYPNPEEHEAMTMALAKGKAVDADIILATDPDADRVGIAIKNDDGEHILLNGNQTGTLLFEYLLDRWEAKGRLKGNEYIVKTIVTTNLIDKIAEVRGVKCFNVLTGFKFIGQIMTEQEGKSTFIAGCEESYGYLIGDHVRDKDAIVACNVLCEMAAYYKNLGKPLYQVLKEIYVKYGFYKEFLISITKTGKKGAEEISELMAGFRQNPPSTLGGDKVVLVKDYKSSTELDIITGKITAIDLPKSNVLQFTTDTGHVISARPSGTEPKIKYYISVNTKLDNTTDFELKEKELEVIVEGLKRDLVK
jgi:phosphoglucomutase